MKRIYARRSRNVFADSTKMAVNFDYLLLTVLLLVNLFASTASAVQQRVFFAPSATDPAITQFNDNHYAVVDPAVTNRGLLVLFLPGTGATPSQYCLFPQDAASLGFHALGLMYPNTNAINILCVQNAPFDPNAAGNARLDGIKGTNIVSAVPNALVLFNPALVLAPLDGYQSEGKGKITEWRMGTKPENISPAHHIYKGAPPTIIFHGKTDTTVPYITAEAFTAEMIKVGNRCELAGYEGANHSFFNTVKWRDDTIKRMDQFLKSLGYLDN